MSDKKLTPDGERKVKEELAQLTGPARLELAGRLRTAIQQGDLSENADYIKAKEDQGFLEGRILELQALLREAEIVAVDPGPKETVRLGCRITVEEEGGEAEEFFLVGSHEANPTQRKISHESPIGKALMNRRVGETVRVATPGGEIHFHILAIQ
jgi:transcription elongation factor GreA